MADIVKKKPVTQVVKQFVTMHGNDIFLGFGIALSVSALGFAIKGTIKAVRIIDEEKKNNPDKTFTKKEILEKVWKCYIPTAVAEAASIACTVKSGIISNKTIAAATMAYKVMDDTHKDYKQAAKELLGEKKEKAISDKANQVYADKVTEKGENVFMTGSGETLFIESYYGHPFRATWNFVEKCVNELNDKIAHGESVSMNDWYELLGLPYTQAGNNEGFSSDYTGLLKVYLDGSCFVNGEPAHILRYYVDPTNRYND